MKKRILSPKAGGKILLVFLLALVILSGCTQTASKLVVSISPANPQESDFQNQYSTFKLIAIASALTSGSEAANYSYQWLKNGEMIPGATSNELPASLMGQQGHTVRGYEFKCQVTATDGRGNKSKGEAAVTVGRPFLGLEMRGG